MPLGMRNPARYSSVGHGRRSLRHPLARAWALALLGSVAPSIVAAAGTHAVEVSATVLSQSVCRFTNSGPSVLAFGSIDPSSAGPLVTSVDTTFRCTGSDPVAIYTISSDDGQNPSGPGQPRMLHSTSPGQFLPYTLNLPQTGSVPRNVVQTLTVTGTMTAAQFANASAGTYADTVVLTIEP